MAFKPPGEAERLQAIGDIDGLPEILRQAFVPGSDFEPIPIPKPVDWLDEHFEAGQTLNDFKNLSWNKPDEIRSRIYLQPLGEFPEAQSPSLELLKEYAEAYFTMEIEVLPSFSLKKQTFTTRINPYTRNLQILTTDVLEMLKEKLPSDGFCILAITMQDLYPHPSWNFVFGQASLIDRVGVYSFARYDPVFYGNVRGKDYQKVLLKRSFKVLVHEMSHIFGLKHCIFYKCVLNGSNHLEESDARPLHLCPVCLRKLQFSIGFDVKKRYQKLLAFYKKVGFEKEALWVSNRLKYIDRQ